LKNRYYLLLLFFAFLLPLAAPAATTETVYAQSCGLQVGSMAALTQNSGGYYSQNNPYNIQLTVPMSIGCQNAGPQLWAAGTVYDTVTGQNLGSNNAIMNSNNGYYSGQLVFSLSPSVVEH